MHIPRTAPAKAAVLLLPTALVLTACGGDGSGGDAAAGGAGFPVTVTDSRGEATIDAAPERIVSLSPTATEMLFAVGAGEEVVAADEFSDYPEDAPATDLSGITPSVEAVSEHDPDLVVLSSDAADAAEQLEAIEVDVLVLDAAQTFDDTYAQLRLLGEATGNAEGGEKAATDTQAAVDDTIAETREALGDTGLSVYHEVDAGMYSATSDTFIGQVYAELGLENIADAAEDAAETGGYPQLSPEFVVEADPDLAFVAYPGEGAVGDFAARDAFDTITAVEEDAVVQLDEDLSSRWGPRVADLVAEVSDAVTAAAGEES